MYSLAFVFSNDEDEHVMKSEIAIRLYEASRQERFEKAVDDASDRAWILESSNREEPEDEEDNDVEMSIDDNDEVRVVRPVDSGNNDSEKNRHLASAIKHNRAFVVRGSKVGVFKHDNDGQLDFVTSIDEIKTNNGKLFSPSKIMLHRGDRQMLMLNPNEENKVYALDLERETIVDEFVNDFLNHRYVCFLTFLL